MAKHRDSFLSYCMALYSYLSYQAAIKQLFLLQPDTRNITWYISPQAVSPILNAGHMG